MRQQQQIEFCLNVNYIYIYVHWNKHIFVASAIVYCRTGKMKQLVPTRTDTLAFLAPRPIV